MGGACSYERCPAKLENERLYQILREDRENNRKNFEAQGLVLDEILINTRAGKIIATIAKWVILVGTLLVTLHGVKDKF